jgi:hypothetical protein
VSKFQQDTFNTVWNHFVVGGGLPSYKPAPRGVECLYRGPNGSKCGIGILIADEDYDEAIEGSSVESLHPSLFGLGANTDQEDRDFEFLMDIQAAHDFAAEDALAFDDRVVFGGRKDVSSRRFGDLMQSQLKSVAEQHGLEVPS